MVAKGITFTFIALTGLVLSPQATAQNTPETAPTVHIMGSSSGMPGKGVTMAFRTAMMDVAPVKGSPFCATVTNDHIQMFADGNKIHTTENSSLCRDSEGRTRRESQLNLLGAVPQGGAPKIITIEDPVAGVRYTLDSLAKVARKMPMGVDTMPPVPPGEMSKGGENVMFYSKTGGGEGHGVAGANVFFDKRVVMTTGGRINTGGEAPPNSESLGDQMIGGIHATGTKITTTIPAGQMGNEQPINVVSENWYSPELKATVMTKHSDPWAGQLTTQFTNVTTTEPDASMFTVPSDYKVVDDKDGPFTIRIKPPVTP